MDVGQLEPEQALAMQVAAAGQQNAALSSLQGALLLGRAEAEQSVPSRAGDLERVVWAEW